MKTTKKITKWFASVNIYWLVITPLIFAILLTPIQSYIGEKIFGPELPEIYINFCAIVFSLIVSLSGFAQVIRKEGPGPVGGVSYGLWPIISGYTIIGVTWSVAIYLLVISF